MFPLLRCCRFCHAARMMVRLPQDVRDESRRTVCATGLLTSIAPTARSRSGWQRSRAASSLCSASSPAPHPGADGESAVHGVEDYAHALFVRQFVTPHRLPPAFVTAEIADAAVALAMQAAVQAHVDSSISKTINCPAGISFEDFKSVYLDAYEPGLKGCTPNRPNPVTGAVLTPVGARLQPRHLRQDQAHRLPLLRFLLSDGHRRSRVYGAAFGARSGSGRLHLQDPLAVGDHAIYVTINDIETPSPPAVRCAGARSRSHQLEEPRALCLDGGVSRA